jgi:hypothetical protein
MINFKEYFDTLSKRVEPIKQWLGYWLIGERFTDWGAGSSWGAHNWREGSIAMMPAIHAERMAAAIHAREIKLPDAAILQQWLTPKLLMADNAEKSSHTPSARYAPNFFEGIQAQRALEREFAYFDPLPVHDNSTPIGKLTELMVQRLQVDIDIKRDQGVIVSVDQTFELNIFNGVDEDVVKTIENCFKNKTSILGAWKIKHSRTMRVDGYATIQSLRAGKGLPSTVLLIVEGFIQPIDTPRNKRLTDFIFGEK